MKYLIIAVLLTFIFLTGCNTDPIKVTTEAVEKAPIVLPSVDQFETHSYSWIIVTPDNVEEVFKKLAKKGNSIALFAVTGKGYESLSLNASDTVKFIQQLKAQIEAYKKYYIVVPKTPKTPKTK